MSKHLKSKLTKSLSIYNSDKFLVGRLHNEILHHLIEGYRKSQILSEMVKFISCLNYFYSTRVQAAEGRMNDNLVKVAKLIHSNWNKGLNLEKIKEGDIIDIHLVDKLRKKIYSLLGRNLFSLATKIFHQLNSQYPIYDSKIKIFLKSEMKVGRVNLFKSYPLFYQHYTASMEKIEWDSKKVDQFDSAIWVL